MTNFVITFLILANTSIVLGSSNCIDKALNAVNSVYSTSRNSNERSLKLISDEVIKRYFWQNENRHTILFHVEGKNNQKPMYTVDLTDDSCEVLGVKRVWKHVSGDNTTKSVILVKEQTQNWRNIVNVFLYKDGKYSETNAFIDMVPISEKAREVLVNLNPRRSHTCTMRATYVGSIKKGSTIYEQSDRSVGQYLVSELDCPIYPVDIVTR